MAFKLEVIDNVEFLTLKKDSFSLEYLTVREKEGRLLTDFDVKSLPITNKKNSNYKEWKLRRKSTQRILNYLKNKNKPLNILDIGCGNGWFTNHMASIENVDVIGLDINLDELSQAARIFKKDNLKFVYADIFEIPYFFENKYNIITLNACLQYFEDIEKLISVLETFLKPNGEIHIIDSPLYRKEEIHNAKKRTKDYYSTLGAPEMSKYYFHHCIDNLQDFEVLHAPKKSKLHKLISKRDSPFFWYKKTIK